MGIESSCAVAEAAPADSADPAGPPSRAGVARDNRALLVTAVAFGHAPLLVRFADHLLSRGPYEFAILLVPVGVVFTCVRAREACGPDGRFPPPGNRRASAALFGVALLVTLAASYLWSRSLNAVAALLTLVALFHAAGGPRLLRAVAPALLLLLVAIPPPLALDGRFILLLRGWAVGAAGMTLDLLNVLHDRKGLLIDLPGRQLLIEEACSGINSLMAVLGTILVAGVHRRASARRVVTLLVAGVGLVLVLNVVRIAGAAAVYARWRVDLFSGTAHGAASLVIWLFCIGFLASANRLLTFIAGDREVAPRSPPADRAPSRDDRRSAAATAAAGRTPDLRTLGPWPRVLVAAYLVCGLVQLRQGYAAGYWQSRWTKAYALRDDAAFVLPGTLAGWAQDARSGRFAADLQTVGARKQPWYFRDGRLVVAVALDYPFLGYHDLTRCYGNGNWRIGPNTGPTGPGEAFSQHAMADSPSHALLLFAVFDERGRWLSPAEHDDYDGVAGRFKGPAPDRRLATYQVQAFVQSYAPLSDDEVRRVRTLFLEARAMLRRQVLDQLERH